MQEKGFSKYLHWCFEILNARIWGYFSLHCKLGPVLTRPFGIPSVYPKVTLNALSDRYKIRTKGTKFKQFMGSKFVIYFRLTFISLHVSRSGVWLLPHIANYDY